METPLHVAAYSLLRHLHPAYTARFYLLLTDFSDHDVSLLRTTLDSCRRSYSLHLLDVSASRAFSEYPDLHGSRSTYHRLLLPDLVEEERLLYLDADIQVNIDVSPLFEADMRCKPVGFVVDGVVRHTLDCRFQTLVGRQLDAPAFNAGVCLFSVAEWRRQNCWRQLMAFGSKYRDELISHDQSMLNALFADNCYRLESKYNVLMYPTTKQKEMPSSGIFHFVGSPKPWDIGAKFLLPHAKPWRRALRETALPYSKRASWFSRYSWLRVPRIAGGYYRALRSAAK